MSLANKYYSVEVTLESNQKTREQILVIVKAADGFDALGKATELYARKVSYPTENNTITWTLKRVGNSRLIRGDLGHGAEVYYRTSKIEEVSGVAGRS